MAHTIDDEGVRVFLHSANAEVHAAHVLGEMYFARKNRETPQARALLTGWHCARNNSEKTVQELARRGGLQHLGCAQINYRLGEYTVRGAQS